MNGLELLRHLGDEIQRIPVIIITGRGSDERVVQAIEAGAFWYIEKPLKPPVLRALLDRALGRVRDQQAVAALTRQLREAGKLGTLVGSSERDAGSDAPGGDGRAFDRFGADHGRNGIRQGNGGAVDSHAFAARRPPVCGHQLLGDSGIADGERNFRPREGRVHGRGGAAASAASNWRTAARCCWTKSAKCPRPRRRNCCACSRITRSGAWAARWKRPWTCACWRQRTRIPSRPWPSGHLRQDLYFRLNVFHIHLPPLREHKDDLALLIEHLLAEISEKHGKKVSGVGADVMELFKSYPWPGNVRELRNVLERAAIASDRGTIGRQHLPPDFGHAPAVAGGGLGGIRFPVGTTVDDAERELIIQTLAATNQNKTRAAELLGISLKTLHNKLKEYEAGRKNASQPEN